MFDWTNTRVETLKAQWADGFSAAQVADHLGGGLSRSAVLGKVHRLGLIKPVKQVTHSMLRITRARAEPRRAAAPRQKPVLSPVPVAGTPPTEPTVITCEHMVRLVNLEWNMCRYPLWRDDTPASDQFYCGTPGANVFGGSPYCPGHARIAFAASRVRAKPAGNGPWLQAAE